MEQAAMLMGVVDVKNDSI